MCGSIVVRGLNDGFWTPYPCTIWPWVTKFGVITSGGVAWVSGSACPQSQVRTPKSALFFEPLCTPAWFVIQRPNSPLWHVGWASASPKFIRNSYMSAHGTRNSYHILPGDQIRGEGSFYSINHAPLLWPIIFVTWLLMCELFVVANLFVAILAETYSSLTDILLYYIYIDHLLVILIH